MGWIRSVRGVTFAALVALVMLLIGAACGDPYAEGAIPGEDDGGSPDAPSGALSTLLVTDISPLEGSDPAAPSEAAFVIRLVPASASTVTVDYATIDDTAKAGSDYTAATGTVTFPPGTTSQTVKVKLTADTIVEPSEAFSFVLSNAKAAILGEPKAICTILDDDIPGVVIDDVVVPEGNLGVADAAFAVRLTAPFKTQVSLNYSTQDSTALVGVDYIASSGTLTFLPGETAKTVLVPIKGDLADEPDKTFFVTLSNVIGGPILRERAQGTVQDDDATPTLSIGDVSAPEGNPASTSSMTFSVTLSAASGQEVTVAFATSAGTATTPDYSGTSGTLTFVPGETTKTISVELNVDSTDEPDETFNVTLASPVNATIADAAAVGTITNDDVPPILTINDVALAEGLAGNTTFPFTLTLSAPSGKPVTVNYSTSNVTATAPDDYTATSGTVTFAIGETVKTVNVAVLGDTVDEGSQTFNLNLTAPVNVTLARLAAVGTILNDDSVLPQLVIDNVTVTEGNTPNTVNANFTVSVSVASSSPITVDFATSDGTASAASGDYVAKSGTLNWAAFDGSPKTITVVVNGDGVFEPNETFFVNLSNEVSASIIDAQGVGTINNDDSQPTVSIAAASDTEGNNGTKQLSVPVTLSGPSSQTISVNYATSNGTATAGSDYSQTSGTLTFAPGETNKTVSVSMTGDVVFEPDETFTVTLSTPVNTTITAGAATGTIANDDAQPSLSIDDVSAAEGANGTTKTFTFTATLSGPSSSNVTVSYATVNGTATAGSDYVAASGLLTFTPGQTSKTIAVTVNGDLMNEANESFSVQLSSAVGAGISDSDGLGTIQNDDSPLPTLSISDRSLTEGNSGSKSFTFTVTLSAAQPAGVTVDWQTANGTAVAPSDYVAASGTLTFSATQTSKTITVMVNGDVLSEVDETFFVNLSNPVNADIFDAQGTGTIVNDPDPVPTVTINNININEGNSGTTLFRFTVTLSAVSGRTVTVNYATQNDSATAPSDYSATSGTVMILPGATTATLDVLVNGDTADEANQRFRVQLSNPVGATLGVPNRGDAIINNDD